MEAFLFACDSFVIVLIAYMGLRDDRRAKGAPQASLFRMRDLPVPAPRRGRDRS